MTDNIKAKGDEFVMTMQEKIDYIRSRFPDAYALQWSLHGWVIESYLCGQIGLYRKTEQEAWDACYELLKTKKPNFKK